MLGIPDEHGAEFSTSLTEIFNEDCPVPSVSGPASPPTSLRPSRPYRDIPVELWYLIFEFLAPPDINRPTRHTLVEVRGVCRLWREVAERLIWRKIKSLIAPRELFNPPSANVSRDIRLWFEDSVARLVKGSSPVSDATIRAEGVQEQDNRRRHRGAENATEFQLVSFHLDERYHPDQNLVKFFVSALSNCVRACITIDHFPASVTAFPSTDVNKIVSVAYLPVIPLRQFAFSSTNFCIRDTLPQQFDFPWNSLRQGLPWSQLTDVTLDCVLTYDDALFVLFYTANAERIGLGRLSSTGVPQGGSFPISNVVSTLHTLKIKTSIDLQPLFSRLNLPVIEDLQLVVYLVSISNFPQNHVLDPNLQVPWQRLKRLSLKSYPTHRQCDLDRILQQCHQLEQLKWQGVRSEFNHLPHGALMQLQELVFASDQAGHRHFYENIHLISDITKLTLSHYLTFLTRAEYFSNLLHITVIGSITIVQLFQILRSRTERLLSGDFRLSTITTQPFLVRCETLQLLRLTLRVADASVFPWGKLHVPQLRSLEMNLPKIDGDCSLIDGKMEAFRCLHPNITISKHPSSPCRLASVDSDFSLLDSEDY